MFIVKLSQYGRRRSDGATLHGLIILDLSKRGAIYIYYNMLDCAGIGVESARMAMPYGNKYVGVDGD